MRIAEIAPPWVEVPPEGYGGIEWIVSILSDGLVDSGHDVTLYATADSKTKACLKASFDYPVSLGARTSTTQFIRWPYRQSQLSWKPITTT
jgi:hypothetical protein